MEFGIINVAAAPVRKKADHRSEMVNQLLFGEAVRILKAKGELWLKIQSLHDGYEGWLTRSLLQETDALTANKDRPYIVTDLFAKADTGGQHFLIPAGACFETCQNGKATLAGTGYLVEGKVEDCNQLSFSSERLQALALPWLNTPYLWGGRTTMGIDCSGFTQIIFRQLGIQLPRDAWQQAAAGAAVESLKEALPGDLIFFGKKGLITHVGVLLTDGDMIHASGRVKKDNIGSDGKAGIKTGSGKLKAQFARRFF